MAAIAAVFTINYVAEMLGEDEDWLYELSIDMCSRKRATCTPTASVRMA